MKKLYLLLLCSAIFLGGCSLPKIRIELPRKSVETTSETTNVSVENSVAETTTSEVTADTVPSITTTAMTTAATETTKRLNVTDYIGKTVKEVFTEFEGQTYDDGWYKGGRGFKFDCANIFFYPSDSFSNSWPSMSDTIYSITCYPYTYCYGELKNKEKMPLSEFENCIGSTLQFEENTLDGYGFISSIKIDNLTHYIYISEEGGEYYVSSVMLKKGD